MEVVFDAIGLEIPNEKAFLTLAEDAKAKGELSLLPRKNGALHGRCWRIGEGLEVWTVLYESANGDFVYADCRPGFRSRFSHRINPWIMSEFDEKAEALVHGFIEDTDIEVLFELQNLTEVSSKNFEQNTLKVGLCGLAYDAEVVQQKKKKWQSINDKDVDFGKPENNWELCGEIVAFSSLRNSLSGNDLFWLYLNIGEFNLEVLVNQRILQSDDLSVGAMIKANVWLQGHLISNSKKFYNYEGIDYSLRTVDFWSKFRRHN